MKTTMERSKQLRKIIFLLAAILICELLFLGYLLKPGSMFIWISIGVIAVVCLYLIVISLSLIKELNKTEKP